jgi:hypothetical protein
MDRRKLRRGDRLGLMQFFDKKLDNRDNLVAIIVPNTQ